MCVLYSVDSAARVKNHKNNSDNNNSELCLYKDCSAS